MLINNVHAKLSPCFSFSDVLGSKAGGHWFDPWFCQYSFLGLMSHCNGSHSSLTAVRCFDCGKAASSLEKISWGVLVKERQESMGRSTGMHNKIETMLKQR